MTDIFDGFGHFTFESGPWTRSVYRIGQGPAVIVIHEIPGLHPLVLDFARAIAAEGMSVFCPSLFGKAGRPLSLPYALGTVANIMCVRREFNLWASNRSSPIVDWLRALARKVHEECGGRGVGAVGMCISGGFALAMMTEPSVVAPVLSQPSAPFTRKGIDVAPNEIACAKKRFENEGLSMIGLRFTSDANVPAARFQLLKDTFGDKFEAIELDGKSARKDPPMPMPAHSVLTIHLDTSDPNGPTMKARDRVIEFLKERTA